jgi:hypothetical protein
VARLDRPAAVEVRAGPRNLHEVSAIESGIQP